MSRPALRGRFLPRAREAKAPPPESFAIGEYQQFVDSLSGNQLRFGRVYFLEVMPDVSTFAHSFEGVSSVACHGRIITFKGHEIRLSPVLESSQTWFHDGFFEGFFREGDIFKVAFKFDLGNDPIEKIREVLSDPETSQSPRQVSIGTVIDNVWRMPRVQMAPRDDLLSCTQDAPSSASL